MALTINQTYARIGMESTPGRMDIQTRRSILELRHKNIQLNLHTEFPKVEIDQHDAFASAGLKGNPELSAEAAQRGYQNVMDYIGRVADDGDTLAAIEKGGNAIAEIAARNSYTEHEFGLGFLPKVGPRITVKGSVQFNPDNINDIGMHNGIQGNFIPGSINVNYIPGQLKIYMLQQASISMKYEPNNIDTYI